MKFEENHTLQTETLAFPMFWQMPKFDNTLETQLSFSTSKMLLIKFVTDLFDIPGEVHQNVMHAKISHFLLPAGGAEDLDSQLGLRLYLNRTEL